MGDRTLTQFIVATEEVEVEAGPKQIRLHDLVLRKFIKDMPMDVTLRKPSNLYDEWNRCAYCDQKLDEDSRREIVSQLDGETPILIRDQAKYLRNAQYSVAYELAKHLAMPRGPLHQREVVAYSSHHNLEIRWRIDRIYLEDLVLDDVENVKLDTLKPRVFVKLVVDLENVGLQLHLDLELGQVLQKNPEWADLGDEELQFPEYYPDWLRAQFNFE